MLFPQQFNVFPTTASRHNGWLFFIANGDPRHTVYTYMSVKRVLRKTIRKEKEESRVTEPLTETPELSAKYAWFLILMERWRKSNRIPIRSSCLTTFCKDYSYWQPQVMVHWH